MKEWIKKEDVLSIIHNMPQELWSDYIYMEKGIWMDEEWSDEINDFVQAALNKAAEDVVDKLEYMCGCKNCILTAANIIKCDYSVRKSLCESCGKYESCKEKWESM